MATVTNEEQEWLWIPFGDNKGRPFPEVDRSVLVWAMADVRCQNYPGLKQSISEFLAGGGYYHGQDTYEKSRKRSDNAWAAGAAERERQKPPAWDDNADWFREGWRQNFNEQAERDRQQREQFHQQQERARKSRESEERNRQQPRQATSRGIDKELAKQIIAAGRRSMAVKNHPDNGGDEEKMKQINAVADWLETLLG